MVVTQVNLTPENDKKVKQNMVDKDLKNKSDSVNDLLKNIDNGKEL